MPKFQVLIGSLVTLWHRHQRQCPELMFQVLIGSLVTLSCISFHPTGSSVSSPYRQSSNRKRNFAKATSRNAVSSPYRQSSNTLKLKHAAKAKHVSSPYRQSSNRQYMCIRQQDSSPVSSPYRQSSNWVFPLPFHHLSFFVSSPYRQSSNSRLSSSVSSLLASFKSLQVVQ